MTTNDIKEWLNATEIMKVGENIFIKLPKKSEKMREFLKEEYSCKETSDGNLIMSSDEFKTLSYVYESSKINWR